MFTSDGTAKQNMQTLSLPYHSGGSDNKKRNATYYLHHLFMLWHQHMIWLFLDIWLFKGDISIFHASSFHILLQTSFGLQIQIQHVPVMQVYVSLEQSYKAKTRGKLAKSHGQNTVHTVQLEILAAVCNTYSLMYVDVLVYYETILHSSSCTQLSQMKQTKSYLWKRYKSFHEIHYLWQYCLIHTHTLAK